MPQFLCDFLDRLIDEIATIPVCLFQHVMPAPGGFGQIPKRSGVDAQPSDSLLQPVAFFGH